MGKSPEKQPLNQNAPTNHATFNQSNSSTTADNNSELNQSSFFQPVKNVFKNAGGTMKKVVSGGYNKLKGPSSN